MPDQDAFEAALDDLAVAIRADGSAAPRLAALRLVYADWLEEQGDPHAAAQRWLAHQGKTPLFSGESWDWWRYGDRPDALPEDLPGVIFDQMPGLRRDDFRNCKEYPSRSSAERAVFKAILVLNLIPS